MYLSCLRSAINPTRNLEFSMLKKTSISYREVLGLRRMLIATWVRSRSDGLSYDKSYDSFDTIDCLNDTYRVSGCRTIRRIKTCRTSLSQNDYVVRQVVTHVVKMVVRQVGAIAVAIRRTINRISWYVRITVRTPTMRFDSQDFV